MANPTLNTNFIDNSFNSLGNELVMSSNGVILKTSLLLMFLALPFAYVWQLVMTGFSDKANLLGMFGLIAGFVMAIIICFAPKNKFLIISTPLYAMCEGLALGFISAIVNKAYPGIASQAAIGTVLSAFTMLLLYKTNIIKCNDKFRAVILNATISIAILYLAQFLLNLFHLNFLNILFSSNPIGIGFSIFVVILASLNLIIDFDNITRFSGKVDKNYEWYFGFSLLVTLVWLYIEIINLLAKLQRR